MSQHSQVKLIAGTPEDVQGSVNLFLATLAPNDVEAVQLSGPYCVSVSGDWEKVFIVTVRYLANL